jgi:broad specificity phosphatase PhoE
VSFRFDKEETPEETLIQVFDRSMELFFEISNDPELKGKNICIVTHTPVLKVFSSVMSLLGQNKEISYHRHDFENGGMIVMDLAPNQEPVLVDAKGVTFRAGSKY